MSESPSSSTTAALLRASGRDDLKTAAAMAQALVALELLKAECERLTEENKRLHVAIGDGQRAHANLLTLLASIDDMTEELSEPTAALVARLRARWVTGGGQ